MLRGCVIPESLLNCEPSKHGFRFGSPHSTPWFLQCLQDHLKMVSVWWVWESIHAFMFTQDYRTLHSICIVWLTKMNINKLSHVYKHSQQYRFLSNRKIALCKRHPKVFLVAQSIHTWMIFIVYVSACKHSIYVSASWLKWRGRLCICLQDVRFCKHEIHP